MEYTIHTDGGSRGNPGPSAIGVVIEGRDIGKKHYGEYLGETTNNVAEYQAVVFGLKKLKSLIGSEEASHATVSVYADSELMVRQLSGQYKVKEPKIQQLFIEVWNLRLDFGHILWYHIPRESNQEADKMVNLTLDREEDKLL